MYVYTQLDATDLSLTVYLQDLRLCLQPNGLTDEVKNLSDNWKSVSKLVTPLRGLCMLANA